MSTEKQVAANRKNAKKSTGPKTPEGKAKSAQNATTHGLTASHDVIKGESQEEFDAHKQSFLDVLNPQNAVEDFLADRVASLAWRLNRAGSIERQMLDGFAADLEYLRQHRSPWDYPASSEDPDLTLGCAVRRDLDNDKTLDRLTLYERRIESSLFKCLTALQYRKRKKNLTSDPVSNPSLSRPTSRDLNNPRMEPTRALPSGTQQKKHRRSRSIGEPNLHPTTDNPAKQTQSSNPENAAIPMATELYNLCRHPGDPVNKPNNTDSPASESAARPRQDRRTTSKKVSTRRY